MQWYISREQINLMDLSDLIYLLFWSMDFEDVIFCFLQVKYGSSSDVIQLSHIISSSWNS